MIGKSQPHTKNNKASQQKPQPATGATKVQKPKLGNQNYSLKK